MSNGENCVEIKYKEGQAECQSNANAIKNKILEAHQNTEVKLTECKCQSVEARWHLNGKTFLVLMHSDNSDPNACLKRMEALKNL